jgi:hypothetical protein
MVGLQINGGIFTFEAGYFLSMMGHIGLISNQAIHQLRIQGFFYAQ